MKHNPGFLKICQEAQARVREIGVEEVQRRQAAGEAFHFIDVREDHEWAAGRAKGAVHLGRGILERDIETKIPDLAAELVLYCGGGFRSALSAESLQKMGYTNVWSMAGGFRAWKESNLPVEGPA